MHADLTTRLTRFLTELISETSGLTLQDTLTLGLASPVAGLVLRHPPHPLELLRDSVGIVEVVASVDVRSGAAGREHEASADVLVAQRHGCEHEHGSERERE